MFQSSCVQRLQRWFFFYRAPKPAHFGKQWAAESTQSAAMMEPPHTCPLLPCWMSTCHGHAPSTASLPPTMRFSHNAGAQPHTAQEEQEEQEEEEQQEEEEEQEVKNTTWV